MSSTSFNSYEYSDEDVYSCMLQDNYGRIVEAVPPEVFYQHTMAQPLVYYAQVLPSDMMQARCQQRKVNQNYFVKAFKWYTQDRPPENKSIRSTELRDFASWLDAKYSEYLHETETDQHERCLQTHETPTYGAVRKEFCRTNETSTAKRSARSKCPWKKRKDKGKNYRDEPSKTSNVTCEFILQPKNLTRPASECCYPTLAICPNKNNRTESHAINKSTRKSQSMTSVCRERAIQDCINMMIEQSTSKDVANKLAYCPEVCKPVSKTAQQKALVHEKLSIHKQEYKTETKKQQEILVPSEVAVIKHKNTTTGSKILQGDSKAHNVKHEDLKNQVGYKATHQGGPREAIMSTGNTTDTLLCHCQEIAGQQYDCKQGKSCKSSNQSDSTGNSKRKLSTKASTAHLTKCCVSCQCLGDIMKIEATTQYNANDFESFDNSMNKSLMAQTTKYDIQDMDFKPRELQEEKVTRSLSIFKNNGIQTSEHSINIVTSDGHEFPLFMKVICADKFTCYRCY